MSRLVPSLSFSALAALTTLALGAAASACAAPTDDPGVGTSTAAATEGQKQLYVSMADQRARAFEGDRCVRDFPISTGKVYAGGNFDTTLHGDKRYYDFPILSKAKVVRMRSPFPGISYDQDVYNTIKLTDWGIYLHEANWTRTGPAESQVTSGDCGHCGNTTYAPHGFSHGCINERHEDAVWLYDWVPAANPTKKVVHLTYDSFAPAQCDHVSPSAGGGGAGAGAGAGGAGGNAGSASNANQVTDITYAECLSHPTHCLEDLRDATGVPNGQWICWKSGARSSTGNKLCDAGAWR